MVLKLGAFVYSKYDFKIRGFITDIEYVGNNTKNIYYKIHNKKFDKMYRINNKHVTIDPCEIIDELVLQISELRENYIDLKRYQNKMNVGKIVS